MAQKRTRKIPRRSSIVIKELPDGRIRVLMNVANRPILLQMLYVLGITIGTEAQKHGDADVHSLASALVQTLTTQFPLAAMPTNKEGDILN